MIRFMPLLFASLAVVISTNVLASENAGSGALPFSADDDADGSRFIWFVFKDTGINYAYLPAKDLAKSPLFKPVPANKIQSGDLAWWKEFVVTYDPRQVQGRPKGHNLAAAAGKTYLLQDLVKKYGPVTWLRIDESGKSSGWHVEVPEANLSFVLPAAWNGITIRREGINFPKLNAKSQHLAWHAPSLTEKSKREVVPGMSIHIFPEGPEENVFVGYSILALEEFGYKHFSIFRFSDGKCTSLPLALCYKIERTCESGCGKAFIIHTLNTKGQFVHITLVSTQETFGEMEPQFQSIIESLKPLN